MRGRKQHEGWANEPFQAGCHGLHLWRVTQRGSCEAVVRHGARA